MANVRYLDVRSRAMNALVKQLETIQQPTYNSNAFEVRVSRDLPSLIPESYSIQILVLDSELDLRCNARRYERINLEIWVYVQRLENEDMEFNLFISDIRRALNCPLQDDTHPQPQMTGILLTEKSLKPLYDMPGEGTIAGLLEYEMEIFTSELDPRLWDDVYDVLVPVDE